MSAEMNEMKWKSLSRVRLFVTPWTVAPQAPPPMGFSRQEYWSGLPFPSPGGLPDPRNRTQVSRIAGRFFTDWAMREAQQVIYRTAKKRKKGLSRVNKMATTLARLLWITKCCYVDKIYIIKALIFTKVPSEFCFNFYCIFYLTPVFPPLYKKLLRVPVPMTSFDIFIFSLYL